MLEIHRGLTAEDLLASSAFQSSWRQLVTACPWATVYQEPAFALTWYGCYRDEYEPVVVTDRDESHELVGLLLAARSRTSGQLVSCGETQAEYDVWLATPDRGVSFIERACDALRDVAPRGRLDFIFLPPNAPTGFSTRWLSRTFLRPFSRPLHGTLPGSGDAQASLKKKGNKSKLNQLKRQGDIAFERIVEPTAFDALLDEMIPLFDVRQASLNGAPPFGSDPRRRDFFRAMFRHGILHVTAMRVGARLAAAHIGHINRDEVVLGSIAHSPFLAKYSVGKFQLLMVAVELQSQGFRAFDLTPAGDYKDRFATHADTAHALTIFFSAADAAGHRVKRALIDVGKRYASTERIKVGLARLRHRARLVHPAHIPRALARGLEGLRQGPDEVRLYRRDASLCAATTPDAGLQRDRLEDLLSYGATQPWQPTPADFMRVALERLASGFHFYSRVEAGRLVQWGWLADAPDTTAVPGLNGTIALPAGAAVIWDVQTHMESRRSRPLRDALAQLAAEAGRTPGINSVFICAADRAMERGSEAAGFRLWRPSSPPAGPTAQASPDANSGGAEGAPCAPVDARLDRLEAGS